MTRPAVKVFLDLIDQAYDRKSWHGTNLRGSLRRVSIEEAAWRPAPGRHNIWEIMVHCAYWKYAVWRRLTGAKRGSFPLEGSNFFERPIERTDAAWRADLDLLGRMHKALRTAVPSASPKHDALVTGIAAHDLYHAGQIQLLKTLYVQKH